MTIIAEIRPPDANPRAGIHPRGIPLRPGQHLKPASDLVVEVAQSLDSVALPGFSLPIHLTESLLLVLYTCPMQRHQHTLMIRLRTAVIAFVHTGLVVQCCAGQGNNQHREENVYRFACSTG